MLRRLMAVMLVLVLWASGAWAQSGPGIWGPMPNCSAIQNPVLCNGTNPICTVCYDSTSLALRMYTNNSALCTQASLSTPCYYPTNIQGANLSANLNANGYSILGAGASTFNGLSGAGHTDGSDSITEMNRPDAIYAETYGAKGDGVTDDGPAIRTAMAAACTGGKPCAVALLPGHTYYINSMGGYDGQCGVNFPNSHEKLFAYGATLKAGTAISHSLVCFQPDTAAAPHGGWESATSYLVSAAVPRGAVSLTLSTPSQASNFTAGDVVFIRGYDASDANDAMGVDIVTAANATTGVLTLAWPTRKSYGAEASTYPVIADVQSALVSDIGLYGGTLEMTAEPGYALNMGEFRHGIIRDVIVQGASTDGYDTFSGIDLLDLTIDHVTASQPCASPFNGASRGMTDVRVTSSVFMADGVCGGFPVKFVMGTGEGVEGFKYSHDYFYDATGWMQMQFGPSSDVTLDHSTVLQAGGLNSASQPLIDTGFIDYGPFDLDLDHNTVIVAGASVATGAFVLNANGSNDSIIDNRFEIYSAIPTIAVQIGYQVPITFSHNYLYFGAAQSYAALEASILDRLDANTIVADGNPYCIDIADPGASTVSLWIEGNNLTGCATPVNYANVSHIPNRVVVGNTGASDYTPNAVTSGLVTAALANTCSQDITLSSGAGTFSNACVSSGSHCDAKDITTVTNTCTVGVPTAGSVGLTGTGSDVCRTWCQ